MKTILVLLLMPFSLLPMHFDNVAFNQIIKRPQKKTFKCKIFNANDMPIKKIESNQINNETIIRARIRILANIEANSL